MFDDFVETALIAFLILFLTLGLFAGVGATIYLYKRDIFNKDEEYVKQLEQSLAEQIQETEVYRGILEEYQIKGIINE